MTPPTPREPEMPRPLRNYGPLGRDTPRRPWWRPRTTPKPQTPSAKQVRDVLNRYFTGSVGEAFVSELVEWFDCEDNEQFWVGKPWSWVLELPALRGYAWCEEPEHEGSMTLDAHIANRAHFLSWDDDAMPQPKPYCPPALVGMWEQVEPDFDTESPTWQLAADGSFQSNRRELPERWIRWSARRSDDPRFEWTLQLFSGTASWCMRKVLVNDTELCGQGDYVGNYSHRYRLRRCVEAIGRRVIAPSQRKDER
jgi:hypothetical protein